MAFQDQAGQSVNNEANYMYDLCVTVYISADTLDPERSTVDSDRGYSGEGRG
jgi:hypothetical protein